MLLRGQKRKELYTDLIKEYIPKNIHVYIEPFGGTFSMNSFLDIRPKKSIYNDIKKYTFKIKADTIENIDYKELMVKYQNEKSFFYLDPPYYGKEDFYGLTKNDKIFHKDLKNFLKSFKSPYIMSYEQCDYIEELYDEPEFKIVKYKGLKYSLRNEMIIIPSHNF